MRLAILGAKFSEDLSYLWTHQVFVFFLGSRFFALTHKALKFQESLKVCVCEFSGNYIIHHLSYPHWEREERE